MKPYLSVVVPCYNEGERIAKTLDALFSYLPQHVPSWEIIAVDDGSTDNTWEILSMYKNVYAHFVPLRLEHKGKGHAVKVGMLTAFGDVRLFMDADLSTPLTEIPAAMSCILQGYDIAIGSREIDRSHVKTTLKRRMMGRIFNALISDLTPSIKDTQCGFKAFNRDAMALFNLQQVDGWAFDVELLYLARMLGYRVQEFPVAWTHDEGSKVRSVSASFEMIRDVLDIPILHREINLSVTSRSL